MREVNIYWIDLFAGAGGTSTGIHLAGQKVVACVNHDENAIAAHAANHPETEHFPEDIRDFKVVLKLKKIVDEIRKKDPLAIIAIWASLECTNFSNAKGGLPRDADSRSLAEHMFMYLEELAPEYFWVENVREFRAWGKLDAKGKPISKDKGIYYMRWIKKVKSYGFKHEEVILNAADFGAYQSRKRLFIQFATKKLPIAWPEQTHVKKDKTSSLFPMNQWKAVRDVLDLQDEGKSIFDRKKDYSENTLKRIYAGLVKFVANGDPSFIQQAYSGNPKSMLKSVDGPAGAITTIDHHALVTSTHLNTYYKNFGLHSIDSPSPTVTTKDRINKIDVVFIDQQFGNSKPVSIDVPSGALTCNPKYALVNSQFILNQYSSGGQHSDIENPSPAVMGVPKQNLVTSIPWLMNTNFKNVGCSIDGASFTLTASRRHPYLINANSSTSPPVDIDGPSPAITPRTHLIINPSWNGNPGGVDVPCCTVIARQDKSPLYLLMAESGPVALLVYENDSETMVKIKMFMVAYNIIDIKMRMLKVKELLKIQGFPESYVLKGNQTEQKKQIGNAVEVYQSTAIAKAFKKSVQGYISQLNQTA